jgi:hypothetical protein
MSKWKNIPKDITPYVGFVYLIINKINNKKYIGKKLFFFKKGKKKVESDWKTYYGSCNTLNADIEKYGKDNFSRIILRFCKTRFEWSYYEMKYQVENEVLFDSNYYNQMIRVRLHSPKKEVKK